MESTFLDNDNTYDKVLIHNIQNKNSESTERRKIVFQQNGYKMQTYIDPFKENNDHTRLIRTVLFRGSFNFFFEFLYPKKHDSVYLVLTFFPKEHKCNFDRMSY